MKKLLIIFILFSNKLIAQNLDKISFKDAVKMGLQNSVRLQQEKNNLVATQASKTSSLMQIGPSLNVQGNAGRNDGNSFNQQIGQVVNGVLDFVSASVNADMPLFNGFNNVLTYKQNDKLNEAQMYLVQHTEQTVIRNVSSQYLQCLLDQQLLLIQQKTLETQIKTYEQIKEQVAAGSRAEVDLYNQEFQVKNNEVLLLRAKNKLRNSKAILADQLQIDPTLDFELEEPNWDFNFNDTEATDVETLKTTALTNRKDLAQVQASARASELGYNATKGTFFPNISLFVTYGSRYNYIHPINGNALENRSFDNQFFEDNTQLTYGASFTIPIFSGLRTRSSVVRRKMDYENARLASKAGEVTVKSDVLTVYQNYVDAKSNYEATQAQLKSGELSYTLEKDRYELGASDIVALTLATQNLTRAQNEAANARYTLMFQQILLKAANGTLKVEDIP
ncbi:MAG: TolC family protein [Cyclobacteriaceae bacterium]|nr:TolC family protein [Cyclobacteriaceae bacterium]